MAFLDLLAGAGAALLATSVGAIGVLAFKCIGPRERSAMLAFSGGLMAYTAIEMLSQAHNVTGDLPLAAAVLTGIVFLLAADKLLPHVHAHLRRGELTKSKKNAMLIAGAITLHNVPEGLAIAAAFAGAVPLGWLVTLSIALQDIPEGLLVAAPLACYGMVYRKAIGLGVFSGIVEFAAALVGFVLLGIFALVTPYALAFAAGAMAYVVLVELLPDACADGMERVAALSFAIGAAGAFAAASLLAF